MMDIDHFKNVNDTFGHNVGDKVLKKVSKIMADKVREGEIVARFGGEEFIVCLCRADTEGAISAAERMRKSVENSDFSEDSSNPLKVTISVGIAMFPQKGLNNADDIIKAADEALYHAKEAGRNKAIVYSESLISSKDKKEV